MKYSILEATGRPVPRQCTDAASEFRKLAKVVYDFARVGTQHADIQHLIDMIILPEARDPASGSHVGQLPSPQCQKTVGELAAADVAAMCASANKKAMLTIAASRPGLAIVQRVAHPPHLCVLLAMMMIWKKR